MQPTQWKSWGMSGGLKSGQLMEDHVQQPRNPKAEARSPRAERRPSSEIRRPKPEAERGSDFGLRRGRAFEVAVVRAGAIGWAAGNTLQIRVHLCSSVFICGGTALFRFSRCLQVESTVLPLSPFQALGFPRKNGHRIYVIHY